MIKKFRQRNNKYTIFNLDKEKTDQWWWWWSQIARNHLSSTVSKISLVGLLSIVVEIKDESHA